MKWFNHFLLLLSVSLFSVAHADSAADLRQLLNATQSMQANFTQTIYDNRGKAIQQSNGRVAFQRPGRFRWEVIKPIPQLIVANATRLWIYDPDLAQVTVRSLTFAAGDAPALLLSHTVTALTQNYTVKNIPAPSASSAPQWFELIPKKSDNFASIQLGFTQGKMNEMRLNDNLDHSTRIHFLQAQTNIPLSPALFVFKPKAHVDVIDETRQR